MACGMRSQFHEQGLNQAIAVKAWNPNHKATRELPFQGVLFCFFTDSISPLVIGLFKLAIAS